MFGDLPGGLRKLYQWGMAAWAILGVLLLLYAVGRALSVIRIAIPPFLVALILVYLLAPLIDRLQRAGVPRGLGVAALYAAFIASVVALGLTFIPAVVSQIRGLIEQGPRYLENLQAVAANVEAWLAARGLRYELDLQTVLENLGGGTGAVATQIGNLTRLVSGTVTVLLTLIVGPAIAFYVLLDLPRSRMSLLRLIPPQRRERFLVIMRDVNRAIEGFVRGQFLIAFIVGVASIFALVILRVPNALAIGTIAGLSNLIPFVGPIVGGIIAAIVAFATKGMLTMVGVIIAFVVIQQVESYLLVPKIMGRTVRIHPATAIVAILLGALVAGIWGMLLAIPVIAGLKALIFRIWFPHLLPEEFPITPEPSARRRAQQDRAQRTAAGEASADEGEPTSEEAPAEAKGG